MPKKAASPASEGGISSRLLTTRPLPPWAFQPCTATVARPRRSTSSPSAETIESFSRVRWSTKGSSSTADAHTHRL